MRLKAAGERAAGGADGLHFGVSVGVFLLIPAVSAGVEGGEGEMVVVVRWECNVEESKSRCSRGREREREMCHPFAMCEPMSVHSTHHTAGGWLV